MSFSQSAAMSIRPARAPDQTRRKGRKRERMKKRTGKRRRKR
jgi:hypothetical protein